jgi:transposase
MTTLDPESAAQYGVVVNQNDGFYQRGTSYSIEKKLEVAEMYRSQEQARGGGRPNISNIAKICRVSRTFVAKVENELLLSGRVVHPNEIQQECQLGPGAKTIDSLDAFVLLMLYLEEPSRSLSSYAKYLFLLTGNNVSESTVSRFWNHAFPIRGALRKPNMVPIDKFKPENILRAHEYLQIVLKICPTRVKFGDEKLLKGSEVYCRQTRRNVLTGEVPASFTPSDFRNTYPIIGFCCIDERTTALHYRIHDEPNDAEQFGIEIENALARGFFRAGDILVLDNAAIHAGGENQVLPEWLWRRFGIFLLFLPTRTPEWNPQELVWRHLVQRLKTYPSEFYDRIQIIRQLMQLMTFCWASRMNKSFACTRNVG